MTRSRHRALIAVAALALVLVAGLLILSETSPQTESLKPPTREVLYLVNDCDDAELTYKNQSGGTEQRDVGTPWSLELNEPSGFFAYVSAQGGCHVAVYISGRLAQEATSTGEYGISTAEAVVP